MTNFSRFVGKATALALEDQRADKVHDEVLFAKATLLARTGRFMDAQVILMGLQRQPGVALQATDLLARIYAQSGLLREAEELWLRAKQVNNHDPHYTQALKRIAQLRGQPAAWNLFGLPVIRWFLVGSLVIYLILQLNFLQTSIDALQGQLTRMQNSTGSVSVTKEAK